MKSSRLLLAIIGFAFLTACQQTTVSKSPQQARTPGPITPGLPPPFPGPTPLPIPPPPFPGPIPLPIPPPPFPGPTPLPLPPPPFPGPTPLPIPTVPNPFPNPGPNPGPSPTPLPNPVPIPIPNPGPNPGPGPLPNPTPTPGPGPGIPVTPGTPVTTAPLPPTIGITPTPVAPAEPIQGMFPASRQTGMFRDGVPSNVVTSSALPENKIDIAAREGQPLPPDFANGVPVPLADPRKSEPAQPPLRDEPLVERQCRVTVSKTEVKKLEAWFVIDTSGSFDSERARLVQQMDKYVNALDEDAEVSIAVTLAHGPGSGNQFAELYNMQVHAPKRGLKDQYVLSTESFKAQEAAKGGTKEEIKKRATNRIIALLTEKMRQVPIDRTAAQGETGLLAVYKAVTDAKYTDKIRSQGFFNPDAALAVFFIFDENDACYDYERMGGAPSYKEKFGKKPAKSGRDPKEEAAFTGVCATAVNGKRLQPDDVLAALREFKRKHNRPLIISGALFTEEDKIPRDFAKDKYADEKEIGRGYLEMIKANNNWAVELSREDFGSALADLGNKSAIQMKLNNVVACDEMNNTAPNLLHSASFEASTTYGTVIPVENAQAIRTENGQSKVQAVLHLESLNNVVHDNPVELDIKWKEMSQGHSEAATKGLKFVTVKKDDAKADKIKRAARTEKKAPKATVKKATKKSKESDNDFLKKLGNIFNNNSAGS